MKDDWPKNRTAFCKKNIPESWCTAGRRLRRNTFLPVHVFARERELDEKGKKAKKLTGFGSIVPLKTWNVRKVGEKNFQIRFTGAPWTWKVVCSNPAREWKRAWMLFQQGTCFQWRRWHHLVIICKEIYFHLRILDVFRSAKRGFLWDFLKAMNERHSSESNRERE